MGSVTKFYHLAFIALAHLNKTCTLELTKNNCKCEQFHVGSNFPSLPVKLQALYVWVQSSDRLAKWDLPYLRITPAFKLDLLWGLLRNGSYAENMIKHIGIITLYLAVLLLSSCENNISEIKAITDPKLVPIQSSFNCTYRYSLKGVVRTEVQAQQLDQYANDSTYLICPKPYVIQFYDSTGAYTGTMTGNEAIFSQKSNTFWTTGQLVLENYKHEKLETSALFFNIDDDIVFTKEPVKITTENSIIQGVGMRSNASFTEYEILQTSGDFNQK